MTRKVIGILVALGLAVVGTIALVAYVSTAEDRALAGEELAQVYVVTSPVPAGTPATQLSSFIQVEEVPVKIKAQGAVDDLEALGDRVAAVDLLPGEQLVNDRMVDVAAFADRAEGVKVPDDMVEVTVELEPQRAVGGLVEPGQTVAVLSSFEPFDLTADVVQVNGEEVAVPQSVASEVAGSTPNSTETILRKVLVTAVQRSQNGGAGGGLGGSSGGTENDRLETAPTDTLLVTLALRPLDAERVVFTAEWGTLWLAIDRDTVPDIDDPIMTRGNVHDDQAPVQ